RGRGYRGRTTTDSGPRRRGEGGGVWDGGGGLGDGRRGRQADGRGRHEPARRVGVEREQPADGRGVLRVHLLQERLRVPFRELAEEVGGVVGVHGLEHIGRALELQVGDDLGLLVVG